ncbi:putative tetratricopeptide-like helical domain superfamily [Dioscorea sansibarensis]
MNFLGRGAASVATLLSSCDSLRALEQIHARIVRKGLEQHHVLVLRFLCICNALSAISYASSAFERVSHPTLPLFNALLKLLSDHRLPLQSSLFLFHQLRLRSRHPPDPFSYPSLLKSCSHFADLHTGASLHSLLLRSGFESNIFVRTSLIDMYGKCGKVHAAKLLFNAMDLRNEVTWTAMIVAYMNSGDLASAAELFDGMPKRNVVSWNAMIDGFVKSGDLVNARKLFDEMPERNKVTFTSLIDGYSKAGDMASARMLFEMLEGKDVFSWSAMITGYVQNGRPGEALKIFLEMLEKNIKPDEFIMVGLMSACSQLGSLTLARWVDSYIARSSIDVKRAHVLAALIDMNAKCGNMERATTLFETMPERDLISYCSLMQGYSIHGLGVKVAELFSRMIKEGIVPDDVVFTVVLTACSHAGLVEEGNKYFCMMKNGYLISPSPDHYACMVDLLGRAGRLKEAYELIKRMLMEPHAGAWGALLGACRLNCDIGLGEVVARKLFEMEPQNGGNYVLLSNIYAAADRWADVSQVRTVMRGRGVRKIPGCTWI